MNIIPKTTSPKQHHLKSPKPLQPPQANTSAIHLETDATVIPLSKTKANSEIPDEIKTMMNNAEKLGAWCATLTLHEIATTLKVRF